MRTCAGNLKEPDRGQGASRQRLRDDQGIGIWMGWRAGDREGLEETWRDRESEEGRAE